MVTLSFGNEIVDASNVDSYDDRYWLDTQMIAPSDGEIRAFRLFAKRLSPIQLVVYRPWGDSFAVIGKSAVETPKGIGRNEFILGTPLPVKAGDLVGFYTPKDGAIPFPDTGADIVPGRGRRILLTPRGGHETQFTETSERQYSLQVILEATRAQVSATSPGVVPVHEVGGGDVAAFVGAIDRTRDTDGQVAGILRYSEAILADSPAGYWKLNERGGSVAHDISGNGRNGIYHGNVKYAEKGAFAEGDAIMFDGKTSFVEISTGTWGGAKELTVEAWANCCEATSDIQSVVAALGQEWVHIQLYSAGNNVVYTDGGHLLLPILPYTPLNTWRHIALVVRDGAAKLYIDGELVGASAQVNFSKIHPTSTIRIGAGYGGGRFFHGSIDEVAIYNHALSPDRIKERVRIAREINETAKRGAAPRQQCAFLRFDGKSWVEVTDPFENPKAFTISFWARPTVLDGGWHAIMGEHWNSARLWMDPSGQLHYHAYSVKRDEMFDGSLPGFFEKDKWVHIAWVKRDEKYEFYKNGQLVIEKPAPIEIQRTKDLYTIGRIDNFWIGDLAEVRFWNVALHPAEVAAEMSRIPRGDDLRLSRYYPFNENDGSIAFDRTGQVDGKIVGGTWKREKTPFILEPDHGDIAIKGAPERKMAPSKKDYYKITTPEQLREHLQHAISLELSTIPPYLYAAYSIKDPKSRASALILGVAFEEMLHMVIACNLLNAIGGSPKMTGPFAPVYPTFIPYHATGGPFIQLQRASRDLMANTFMQIEQPGVGRPLHEMEDGAAFETIGQFYESIADGFRHCDEHHRLFIGDMARQQKAAYFGGGGGKIIPVTDLDSALRAIEEIVAQGEGTKGAYQGYGSDATEGPPPVGSFGQDRKSRELAHYFKFAALATGEVEIPETWPMETNFRTSHFGLSKEKKWARDLSDLCNACYVYMLKTMEHALNRPASDAAFFSSSFPLMRSVVTPLGRLLAQTPLRRNNVVEDMEFDKDAAEKIAPILVTAGPSFEYVEWSYEQIVETCSALLEPGVCPDDEETAEGYKDTFMTTLARVLTALEGVERIHDGNT